MGYSCFAMFFQFLLYSEVNQPYVYIYPLPSGFPSHLGHHRALSSFPCYIAGSHQISIPYTVVYTCQSQSPNSSHPTFPALVSIRLFSMSVSLFLLCKQAHLYHFSRFHIYALIHNICFSLSDLARTWKQPKCPSTDEWIKKMWYIYTMEYYSAIKRNEVGSFVETWMNMHLLTLVGITKLAETRTSAQRNIKEHQFTVTVHFNCMLTFLCLILT